uniref:LEM domain-containing protein n=1 Tax=Anopheles dirus TaxID=7168 RepID=A0A182NXP2_9DIPT
MADNFDDMSNDQLRLKLLECGFSNMPVTSTTRKVLIKKLRNHISSGNGATGKAGRRETIHNLTKYSSDEDSESAGSKNTPSKKAAKKKEVTNRRATIDVAAATAKLPKPVSASQPAPKATNTTELPPTLAAASIRRYGRLIPAKEKNLDLPSSQPTPKVPAILEDSDDDMTPLSQLPQRERKSKSPSLSRAEMLTTSYVHQVEVLARAPEPISEEMEIDVPEVGKNADEIEVIVVEDDDDAYDIPALQKPTLVKEVKHHQQRDGFRTNTSDMTGRKASDDFNFVEPSSQKYATVTVNQPEPSSLKYGSTITTTERSLPKPTIGSTSVRSSMSSAIRDDVGPKFDPSDSPYLSEFTKRLSRLRAEAGLHPRDTLEQRGSSSRWTMIDGDSSS